MNSLAATNRAITQNINNIDSLLTRSPFQIVNGSSAHLQGDLKNGDLIRIINGVDVAHLRSFDFIIELMQTRATDVELVVVQKFEVSY